MTRSKRTRERLQRLKENLEERLPATGESSEAARARREQERADLVERRIQEAMANGEFDNLRGKGKPLPMNKNPYLDPSQELAFGLLQNNGFAPEWIERDKEIRRDIETIRAFLHRAWQAHLADPANEAAWQKALARFDDMLARLNRKIDDFNLMVPILSSQRPRLRRSDELSRVQA